MELWMLPQVSDEATVRNNGTKILENWKCITRKQAADYLFFKMFSRLDFSVEKCEKRREKGKGGDQQISRGGEDGRNGVQMEIIDAALTGKGLELAIARFKLKQSPQGYLEHPMT